MHVKYLGQHCKHHLITTLCHDTMLQQTKSHLKKIQTTVRDKTAITGQ